MTLFNLQFECIDLHEDTHKVRDHNFQNFQLLSSDTEPKNEVICDIAREHQQRGEYVTERATSVDLDASGNVAEVVYGIEDTLCGRVF